MLSGKNAYINVFKNFQFECPEQKGVNLLLDTFR